MHRLDSRALSDVRKGLGHLQTEDWVATTHSVSGYCLRYFISHVLPSSRRSPSLLCASNTRQVLFVCCWHWSRLNSYQNRPNPQAHGWVNLSLMTAEAQSNSEPETEHLWKSRIWHFRCLKSWQIHTCTTVPTVPLVSEISRTSQVLNYRTIFVVMQLQVVLWILVNFAN